MNENTIPFALALAIGALSFIGAITTFVYAQSLPPSDKSETETDQEIKQKNVCSGWAVCTNIAENDKNSGLGANAQ